jgi:excisionase family DNA binding protein
LTPDSSRRPNPGTPTLSRLIAVSPAQAAKLAGVGRTTIYEALGSGALASYLVGRRRLILITDLEAWIRRTPAPLPRLKPRAQRQGESPRSDRDDASTPHGEGR